MLTRSEVLSTDGGMILLVTLCEGTRSNALTPALADELHAHLQTVEDDESLGALVITHEGKAFCAGSDLKHLQSVAERLDEARAFLSGLVSLFSAIERCSKPTIAAIEGAAIGGGFELALACDFRVMGSAAFAALPEVGFGALPGGGGVQRLARFVGRGKALEYILLGDRIPAEQCGSVGLARCVPQGAALNEAIEIGSRMAAGPRFSIRSAKRLILESEANTVEHMDIRALDAMIAALDSAEGREGLRAIGAKRRPDFERARRETK